MLRLHVDMVCSGAWKSKKKSPPDPDMLWEGSWVGYECDGENEDVDTMWLIMLASVLLIGVS